LKLRSAQTEARKEIDEYRAQREAKLRTVQPEAQALEEKTRRITSETDRSIKLLEEEYQKNKDIVTGMLLQVVLNIDNPFGEASK
jgi:Vacuolar (H+)-ATPase G subunit